MTTGEKTAASAIINTIHSIKDQNWDDDNNVVNDDGTAKKRNL